MQYIFHEGQTKGEYPVNMFQIAWYDMTRNDKACFDESFYSPEQFDPNNNLIYLETKENEDDGDRCRTFVHMKNGDIYELLLKKIDNIEECQHF